VRMRGRETRHIGQHRRLKEAAACLPPVMTLAPFLTASAMCASTFSTAFMLNEGPDRGARLEPVGDLHRARGLGDALGKGVVDAVLHQDPVGSDAGLAGIRYFEGIAPPASAGASS
jgi:hypothetical protein